jgi:drug/metabolite transporter (DMT)-like permease
MIYALLVLQQIIASTTHIFAKNLTFDLPPTTILLFRSFFAVIFFVLFLTIKGQRMFAIERKDVVPFLILGLLNIPLNQYLFFVSIKMTTASNVALAYALSPIFILLISVYFLKEEITLRKTFGIVSAFVGISLILFERGLEFKSEYFIGNLVALLASLAWSVYSTYGKVLITRYGSIYSTFIAMLFGFLLYLPISFLHNDIANIPLIKPVHWSQIIYLAVLTSGIAYLIWYYAIKRLPASSVGVFNNLQPIFTTILAIIFLNQSVSFIYIIGGLLVIGGVYAAQKF